MAALEVLATGPLALLQDLGRPGYAALGVSPSGAADRAAYALACRLLGAEPGCAAVEVVLGGLAVRADGAVTIALTGAAAPATVDDRPVAHVAPLRLADGAVLRLGTPAVGLRTYLAVRGGIDAPLVLGSRSTDVLAGIGPSPLRPGDVLPVGPAGTGYPGVDHAPVPDLPGGTVVLDVLPGPRADWLADPADLARHTWTVSDRSNRVGVRLTGPALARRPDRQGTELASEGMVRGAIQLPPAGEPVVFLADHPVTGGYPVVGVTTGRACDALAQARPGQSVRFRLS